MLNLLVKREEDMGIDSCRCELHLSLIMDDVNVAVSIDSARY